MKKIGTKFIIIGFTYLIAIHMYEFYQETFTDVPGDCQKVYDDAPILRSLLGVRTDYYKINEDGEWEDLGTYHVAPARWMRSIGLPELVYYGDYNPSIKGSTDEFNRNAVTWCRRFVKIIFPIIFIFTGFLCNFFVEEKSRFKPHAR